MIFPLKPTICRAFFPAKFDDSGGGFPSTARTFRDAASFATAWRLRRNETWGASTVVVGISWWMDGRSYSYPLVNHDFPYQSGKFGDIPSIFRHICFGAFWRWWAASVLALQCDPFWARDPLDIVDWVYILVFIWLVETILCLVGDALLRFLGGVPQMAAGRLSDLSPLNGHSGSFFF